MSQVHQLLRLVEACWSRTARQFDELATHEQTLVSAWAISGLVENGGFSEVFASPSSYLLRPAEGAYRDIGALRSAELVHQAIEILGAKVPTNEVERLAIVRGLNRREREELDAVDRAFWADPDDLVDVLARFVSSHPGKWPKCD